MWTKINVVIIEMTIVIKRKYHMNINWIVLAWSSQALQHEAAANEALQHVAANEALLHVAANEALQHVAANKALPQAQSTLLQKKCAKLIDD